ncbi:MAG: hypothetical protein HYZ43_11320, partial [Flavobacteriia bacterium]|nr:hypothetical protein [Flavobacteriia bacterium]
DGVFMMNLEPCHEYEVVFHHTNGATEFYRETLKTDCSKEKEEIYREIFLDADKWEIVKPPVVDTTPVVDTVIPVKPTYEPLAYKRNFGYNKNAPEDENGSLKQFFDGVDAQLKAGREKIVIEIYSSASYVPTAAFKDNQELSESRAQKMEQKVNWHFRNSKYKDRVEVKVVSAVVSGPAFGGDRDNTEKYWPYQFVELKAQ